MKVSSIKYKHCNHHHELTENEQLISLNGDVIVADKKAIPLLEALNNLGLKTRTHHADSKGGFVSILLDNVRIEVKQVQEVDSTRNKYDGKFEALIVWSNKE
jgi:hypothetical protein